MSHTHAAYKKAINVAERNGWIVKRTREWQRGSKAPPGFEPAQAEMPASKPEPQEGDSLGRLPLNVRLARVVEFVTAADGPVTRAEAAQAAGLQSATGSFARIIRKGKERGLLETRRGAAARGGGSIMAGPQAPVAA